MIRNFAQKALLSFFFVAQVAVALRVAPLPLAHRVQQAETVFVGKLVNKVVQGEWVQAELLVEEPMKNAVLNRMVKVVWRSEIDGMPIYDVAEGVRGIAILSDQLDGRYWLRADKFEEVKRRNEIAALITASKATNR